MPPTGHKPGRRSIRLPAYDYTRRGSYFVTICAREGKCLFGKIAEDKMILSEMGQVAADCWRQIPAHFLHVKLDAFIIMPNHVHGILTLVNDEGSKGTACRALTTVESFGKPVPGSLPTIMRSFKSAVTKRINEQRGTPGAAVWQRNYYEHVIRDEIALNRIRDYIQTNPLRWALDRENPNRQGSDDFDLWFDNYLSL